MGSIETQFMQIDKWLSAGDIKRAEVQIAKLLRGETTPAERAELFLRRARARVVSERPDEALEDLQTCRALAPALWELPTTQELLGDAHFSRFELAPVGFAERADTDRAMACYKAIEREHPTYPNMGWVMYQWGRILLSEDKVDEAIAKFNEALVKPASIPALTALCYERLGFAYMQDKRDPATALSFFARAASTYPKGESAGWLVSLHLLRSRAFREQHHYDDALGSAQMALSIADPSEPDYRVAVSDAHLSLGEILSVLPGREREAADHLEEFLQHSRRPQGVDVTWSRVHETLGEMWFRLERYEQAIEAYHSALAFNPYHPWELTVYYQIARSHYQLREYEKTIAAIEQMQKVAQTEQQPIKDHRVYSLLGDAHFALSHHSQASVAYQQAVDLAPQNADNLDTLKTYLKFARELAQKH